jgi:hypothetical protein
VLGGQYSGGKCSRGDGCGNRPVEDEELLVKIARGGPSDQVEFRLETVEVECGQRVHQEKGRIAGAAARLAAAVQRRTLMSHVHLLQHCQNRLL